MHPWKKKRWLPGVLCEKQMKELTDGYILGVENFKDAADYSSIDLHLSNNGYKVYNIGIKIPAETIIEEARKRKVDIVGLSGLLVKSAIVMQESMPQYREAGLGVPILLGGAALTPKFVADSCVPEYDRPVVYCADAFAGLKAVRDFEEGKLISTVVETPAKKRVLKAGPKNIDVIRRSLRYILEN